MGQMVSSLLALSASAGLLGVPVWMYTRVRVHTGAPAFGDLKLGSSPAGFQEDGGDCKRRKQDLHVCPRPNVPIKLAEPGISSSALAQRHPQGSGLEVRGFL